MPSGSVIRYEGKRGLVWRIKYTDAGGVQQMETLGRASDGWTERKAGAALEKRLEAVEKGWRKPKAIVFGEYAERWFAAGPKMRGWKPGTVKIYVFAERRLVDWFGSMPLDTIRPRHVAEFIAEHPNGSSSVRRDHACLHAILESARKEELIDRNPAENAELPPLPRNRWRLVKPDEVPVIRGRVHRCPGPPRLPDAGRDRPSPARAQAAALAAPEPRRADVAGRGEQDRGG